MLYEVITQKDGQSVERPAIAYDASRGLFAVSSVRGDALQLHWLRCDA